MKRIYWRPQKVSRKGLTVLAVAAMVGMTLVLRSPIRVPDPWQATRQAAAEQAARMMQAVKSERERRGLAIEPALDPAASGLIGAPMSLVTSRPSHLGAKQTTVNANFAAAIVQLLVEADVRPGDTVAVGWSGSFPALNICVCAALDHLQVRPLIIASATASQYGANLPEWMWLDMETHLRRQGLTRCRSMATSIGGAADRGVGLSDAALQHIRQLAERNDVPLLQSAESRQAVQQRLELYGSLAERQPIKAYINVGGGMASTGGEAGRAIFQPGLNRRLGQDVAELDCVMAHFAARQVPVIHLNQTTELAEMFGFPVAPTTLPQVGDHPPLQSADPNRLLAGLVVAALLGGMWLCVCSGQTYERVGRITRQVSSSWRRCPPRPPQGVDEVQEPQLMV